MIPMGGLVAAAGFFAALVMLAKASAKTTSGEVQLMKGGRYLFTYTSSRPVDLSEVAELLSEHSVTALAVAPLTPGYWHVSFEAIAPATVRAKIGAPLLPGQEQIRLSEVERIG